MKPIFLIGYMGCGKSTLGRTVAKLTGREVYDLDNYIENRFHRSIREIFAERGEEGFRRIEAEMLREVGEFDDVIVACGGGTPCNGSNMEYMNSRGITVWLDAPVEVLHRRLCRGRAKRPLIAAMDDDQLRLFIAANLERRRPFYSQAQVVFPSTLLENETEAAQTARRFLDTFNIPYHD